MQERRKFVRVETPVLLEFSHPQHKRTERSFTQDVSEAGMRFPTTVKFRVGDTFRVTITLPLSEQGMTATAKVMWVREVARYALPQYEVGASFDWVKTQDRDRFNQHMSALLGSA